MSAIPTEPQPAVPLFRAYLLGPSALHWRTVSLSAEAVVYQEVSAVHWGKRRQAMRLLMVLLARPGRRASKDFLTELFWPDTEPEQAAVYLIQNVAKLRKVLRMVQGGESLLIDERAGYRLASQQLLWVDADAAEALMQQASAQGTQTLPLVQQAVTLLQRGTLLQEEEGTWVLGRRGRLEDLRKKSQIRLAQMLAQQGRLDEAESTLYTLLEEDPTDEEVLCCLMQLLRQQGMTQQALRVYERSCEVAATEGLEPTEELRLLAERLRSEKQRSVSHLKHRSLDWEESTEQPSQEMYAFATGIAQPFKEAESQILQPSRRQLMQQALRATGTAMVASSSLLEQFAQVLARPSTIDEATLGYLETRTAHYWRDRHSAMVASSLLLDYVLEHLQKILTFLEYSLQPSERRRLCALASGTAQLIGHLFFDLGDYRHARKFHEKAIQAAQEAGNAALEAAAWGRMSFTWSYSGHVQKALPCIQQARSLAAGKTAQVVQAYLSAIEAEIQAMLHDREASLKALGEAEWINTQSETGEDHYWLRFDRSRLEGYQGTCFQRFYRPEDPQTVAFLTQAQKTLKEALTLLSPSMMQRRPALLIDLARTFTQQGEIGEACEHAIQAIILLAQLQSRTGMQRLLTLRQDLEPWLETSSVKKVDEHIEALLIPEWQRSL